MGGSRTILKPPTGSGSGLDADKVDGHDSAYFQTAAGYNASDVLSKLLSLDGSGSGVDADLLDGHNTDYFLAAVAYTAADVLSKLLTVDGSGSGLDADALDGHDASYFLASSGYTAADVLSKLLGVDGSGSGLDADLLDGVDILGLVALTQAAIFNATSAMLMPSPQASGQYATPGGNTAAGAPTKDDEVCFPIMFMEDWTATILAFNVAVVGGAGSVVRFGLRADAGNGHYLYPGQLINDFGTVATAAGTGQKTLSINQALTKWTPYWLSVTAQVGTSPSLTTFNAGTAAQIASSIVGVRGYKCAGQTGALALGYSNSVSDAAVVGRVLLGKA